MSNLNKAIILGTLGRDPETRLTQAGEKVCNLNIATKKSYTNRDGGKVEKTEWHRVVLFGKHADIADKYCAKGKRVLIEGELTTRKWTDQQSGIERYTTEIHVGGFMGKIVLIDYANKSDNDYHAGADNMTDDGQGGKGGDSPPKNNGDIDDFEDDVPF